MIPQKCEMPDLSDVPELTGTMLLAVVFGHDPNISPLAEAVRKNLARLIDKAVRSYQAARIHLIARIEQMSASEEQKALGRIITIFRFVDELENCLLTVRRLIRFLEQMQSDRSAPIRDNIQKKLTEVHSKGLPGIRDAFEHLTEKFGDLGLEEGGSVMIAVDASDEKLFRVGNRTFAFSVLAKLIKAIHVEVGEWVTPSCRKPSAET